MVVYALTEVQCSECATGDAGDVGARDCEGEEGEGGALGIEGEGEEGDLVWGGVIGGEIAFANAGLGWPWTWGGEGGGGVRADHDPTRRRARGLSRSGRKTKCRGAIRNSFVFSPRPAGCRRTLG